MIRAVQISQRLGNQVQHDVPVPAGAGKKRDPVGECRIGDISMGFIQDETLLNGTQVLVGNVSIDL